MEISMHPEVTFRVGRVRTSLWRKPTQTKKEECAFWITLSRAQTGLPARNADEEALDATEIPQAILALKKAHDYMRRRPTTAPEKEFLSADALIQRIP